MSQLVAVRVERAVIFTECVGLWISESMPMQSAAGWYVGEAYIDVEFGYWGPYNRSSYEYFGTKGEVLDYMLDDNFDDDIEMAFDWINDHRLQEEAA